MFGLSQEVVVFDTEFTTWKGAQERNWSGPGEYREIVEIGAVRVETKNFAIIDSFLVYVKPRINSALSDFFVELTGITQEKIDGEGVGFPRALKKFHQWSDMYDLYCFGSDGNVLEGNAKLLDISFPFDQGRFHDIRGIFERNGIPARNYTSGTIVEVFGKKATRRAHDALHDAMTIVDGLRLLQRQRVAL